jgi:signal transduction histidine kinase
MSKARQIYIFILLLIVVAVGLLHTFTPIDRGVLHDIYRRVSYLPIVMAALLFGIRGGLLLAACTSIAFIPHLRHFYHLGPSAYLSELPEVLLYFGAGILVGAIAGKEQKLRIKYQDLSRRLEKSYKKLSTQTGELVAAEEQLRASQKLSALGQLSASLAHEVKNPLASIRGAIEILSDDFPPGHPKHEFSEILLKETSRLSNTVEEVLRFSRNQQPGPERISLEPLSQVLERVATLLDNKFRKKNIVLNRNLAPDVDNFMVNGDKMAQVFINLLLNSCESMDNNGTIEVQAGSEDGQLLISFADNGPGIPVAERENIFTPFYSTRKEGTGLGLAISSRIVESYGGSIRVGSRKQGRGVVFTVSLPDRAER